MRPYDYAKRMITECHTGTPLKEMANVFNEENIGSVLVKSDNGAFAGMLTDKVIYDSIANGIELSNKKVGDLKLEPIIWADKDEEIEVLTEKFKKSPSGRVVMTDMQGKPVGILKRKNIERFSMFKQAERMIRR
ncbi:MAG: CBS domain-containing protein [Candidatus Altiarchaeota archaeon]